MRFKIILKFDNYDIFSRSEEASQRNEFYKLIKNILSDKKINVVQIGTSETVDETIDIIVGEKDIPDTLQKYKDIFNQDITDFRLVFKENEKLFFSSMSIFAELHIDILDFNSMIPIFKSLSVDTSSFRILSIDIQENYRYKLDHLLGEIHPNMGRYAQWFHIFTPKVYQDIITKEALLNTPAYKVEDLGNDIIFIQTHKDPDLLEKDKDAYTQLMKGIDDYLFENEIKVDESDQIESEEQSVLSEPKPEPTIYDKSDWHIGDLPEGLSQEQGYIPTSLYLMWLAENDLYAESLQGKMKEQAQKVKEGKESVTSFYEMLGGYFTSEELNEEGQELTKSYFDLDGGSYHMDYEMELKIGDQYATIYHVPATLDSYETLKPRLNRRLHNFREYGLASLGW